MLAIVIAAGFGSMTGVGIPSALAMDLSIAAREALQYDATFLAARKKAEADATRYGQGLGLLLPSASVSAQRASTSFSTSSNSSSIPTYSGKSSNTYGLTLTQPLLRLDLLASFNQEKQRSIAGEANFTQARIDALLRVTQAYFDVLVAQDTLTSLNANLKAIAEQLESAKRNFEVGTTTVTDQQEAQSRFDLATAQQIAARNDLEVKRNSLTQLVGMPLPQRLAGLRSQVTLQSPQPLDMESWAEQARSSNYKVLASSASAEIARNEVSRVVSAGNLPSLDLVARKTRVEPYRLPSGTGDPIGYGDTESLTLQLTMPLFNGGIALNQAKEAIALRDKTGFDLENERRTAEQSARTSYLGVVSGLSQVKAYEAAEKSSRLALESNLLGYQVGVRINIDVLNAQQQLYAAQRDLSKSRYDTLINSLKLKAAVGSLNETDIDEVNGLLAK